MPKEERSKNKFFSPDDMTKRLKFYLGDPDKIPVLLHSPRYYTRDDKKDDPDNIIFTAGNKEESEKEEQ